MPRKPIILPKRLVRVVWKRLRDDWGLATPDDRLVELDPRMDDLTLLSIAPHEYGHVYFPKAGEARVTDFGNDLGHFLHGLGFRRIEGDTE